MLTGAPCWASSRAGAPAKNAAMAIAATPENRLLDLVITNAPPVFSRNQKRLFRCQNSIRPTRPRRAPITKVKQAVANCHRPSTEAAAPIRCLTMPVSPGCEFREEMMTRRLVLGATTVVLAFGFSTAANAVELNPAAVAFQTPDQFKWRDPTDQAATNQVILQGDPNKAGSLYIY